MNENVKKLIEEIEKLKTSPKPKINGSNGELYPPDNERQEWVNAIKSYNLFG